MALMSIVLITVGLSWAPNAAADANGCNTSGAECTFHCHAGQLVTLTVLQEDVHPGSSAGSATCGSQAIQCSNTETEEHSGDCTASGTTSLGGTGVCSKTIGRYLSCSAA
jgi:hypothetical protein